MIFDKPSREGWIKSKYEGGFENLSKDLKSKSLDLDFF